MPTVDLSKCELENYKTRYDVARKLCNAAKCSIVNQFGKYHHRSRGRDSKNEPVFHPIRSNDPNVTILAAKRPLTEGKVQTTQTTEVVVYNASLCCEKRQGRQGCVPKN